MPFASPSGLLLIVLTLLVDASLLVAYGARLHPNASNQRF